ncbi:MAG TPA: hypothetical protein GX742_04465 [Acholeplasmataceae bacterium]|nr:hypothetical protein [Acholeplasmataceae bacterium]
MQVLLTLMSILNMYQVVWNNTHIEIPLQVPTTNYYELPEAELYLGNNLIKTDKYYYERGVNRTSLTVVNSNHVKSYKIDYRITFYELGITSEQTITFEIVDEIPPTILKVPTFKYPLNTKLPQEKIFLEDFYYYDNYYDNSLLTAKVNNLGFIDINRVGIYEIEFEVMDPSFNTSKITTTYEVYDSNYPEIIMNKEEIEHPVNKDFKLHEYFKFKGNNLRLGYDDKDVKYNRLGTYQITVWAVNESGLKATISTNIKIVDLEKPKIIIKSNISDINVNTEVNKNYLLNYVLSVSDNYDEISIFDVIVSSDLDTKVVGKYFINYLVSDLSGNQFETKINVFVKDLIRPEIVLLKEIVLNINDQKPYYLNYFDISDNYDENIDLTIVFNDKNVNYNKIGTYYLEVSAKDGSNNLNAKTVEIIVSDLINPNVEQIEDIFIYDFKKPTTSYFKNHFKITDNYDDYENISLIINDDLVNYDKLGVYELDLIFLDTANNKTTHLTNIYIIDNKEPVIELTNSKYHYYIGNEKIDLINLIIDVYDNYDDLTLSDVLITSDIDYDQVGKYEVSFEVSDTSLNKYRVIMPYYVDVKKENLIEGTSITLSTFEQWQPLLGVALSENVVKYTYLNNSINSDKIGTFEVIYLAYDKRGNFDVYKQKILIEGVQNENKNYKYIYIVGISIIYIIFIAINYNKDLKAKKEYFDNHS